MSRNVTIKILRTTSSTVNENTNVLANGEIAYLTDTKQLFIGDGIGTGDNDRLLSGRALSGTLPIWDGNKYPVGTFWVVEGGSTGENSEVYVSADGEWEKVGVNNLSDLGGTLDDIADGITYGKVDINSLDDKPKRYGDF